MANVNTRTGIEVYTIKWINQLMKFRRFMCKTNFVKILIFRNVNSKKIYYFLIRNVNSKNIY